MHNALRGPGGVLVGTSQSSSSSSAPPDSPTLQPAPDDEYSHTWVKDVEGEPVVKRRRGRPPGSRNK